VFDEEAKRAAQNLAKMKESIVPFDPADNDIAALKENLKELYHAYLRMPKMTPMLRKVHQSRFELQICYGDRKARFQKLKMKLDTIFDDPEYKAISKFVIWLL
jgi:hypothetical protein